MQRVREGSAAEAEMGLLFSEKTQIIRAFKAASESVKADADGSAPFETETERRATKKLMEDTRAALITMGFVPEAVLKGEIVQRNGSLNAGQEFRGGVLTFNGTCIAPTTVEAGALCYAYRPESFRGFDAQEPLRRDVCTMSLPSSKPRLIGDAASQSEILRELLNATGYDPVRGLSVSIAKKIQDLIDVAESPSVDEATRKQAASQLGTLGVWKKKDADT